MDMYFSARTHLSYSCPSKRKSIKSEKVLKVHWRTSVPYCIIYMLSLESHNWISEWNTRQPSKEIAAAPFLLQRLPAGRKKQTLKVSEFQSRYIVSSKIWREIFSRWFDVLCTGSFCRCSRRSQKVYKILSCKRQKSSQLIIEGVNKWAFSLPTNWGANWKLNDRPNGIWFCHDLPDGGKQNNAAVRFRGRNRKTTFGENGKQSANFSRNSSVLHPWFLLFVGKLLYGQDLRFLQISPCKRAWQYGHRLRRFHWEIRKFCQSWTGLFPVKTGLLQMRSEMRWNSKWLQESRRKTSWPRYGLTKSAALSPSVLTTPTWKIDWGPMR